MTDAEFDTPHEDREKPARQPSKTELKRLSADLRDLGGELIHLSRDQLERLGLPSELVQAVSLARSMKQDGAFKRQKKYIGKLLRNIDPEPIQAELAAITRMSTSASRLLHCIEAWRDRLITEGDAALADLMKDFPQAERPRLRHLVETARQEKERGQPPKASRLIFKYVRELMAAE